MKQSLQLTGDWQLVGCDPGGQNDWGLQLKARVPGEVHVDLYRAGLIPDPYFGRNAEKAQWVEEKQWSYQREFEVKPGFLQRQSFLEFDGLDTYATVLLNGREVGKAENMFVPHRFDVTGVVQEGANSLAVRFEPAAGVLAAMDHSDLFGCFDTPRVHARKMQCAFGWDWTHRFVGAGIWRPVRLSSYGDVSIRDVLVVPEIDGGRANAWITVGIQNHSGEEMQVVASIVVALGEAREKVEIAEWIPPDGGAIEAVIRIEEPQLWWPNGLGEQPLYTCMAGVQTAEEIQDVAERRFGIRTVRLLERDGVADAFTLMVNGERVFCKGANWIPADHFVSNVGRRRYRELLRLARDANLNMLRVWGGGIYESEAFYEACDEMGIMVWQDFMFSCASYPDDERFAENVAAEVEAVVKHLRGHPCIVLWCGNNECEMNLPPDADWHGKRLFHELIPKIVDELDGSRPYRPSSPFGGSTGNDPTVGDRHGGAWFKAYTDPARWREHVEKDAGLFLSEFVTQGPPLIGSIRKFIPESSLFPPTNELWEYHNRDNPHSHRTDGLTHQQILTRLTQDIMGEFESVEQFAAYSGILQGEFLKAEIEHHRREKWAISGSLFWMYNDCWPAVGFSVVDYYLQPKIAYYYVKRAFAPVIISFKPFDNSVRLCVTSDERLGDLTGTIVVGVYTFGACGFDAIEAPVSLPANSSAAVWESAPLDEILTDPTGQCIAAFLNVGRKTIARTVYFHRLFREMRFPEPKLFVQREQIGNDALNLAISADDYARNVEISNLPDKARVSDNYFDLLPGEIARVRIDGITEEQAGKLAISVWRK